MKTKTKKFFSIKKCSQNVDILRVSSEIKRSLEVIRDDLVR